MSRATITSDPAEIEEWLNNSKERFRVRLFSAIQVGGPVLYDISVDCSGKNMVFALTNGHWRGIESPDEQIRFRLDQAALRNGSFTAIGDLVAKDQHGKDREDKYGRQHFPGLWYPDIEFTAEGVAIGPMLPRTEPSVEGWVPVYRGREQWPNNSIEITFDKGIQALRKNLDDPMGNIVGRDGDWLASRGRWDYVMSQIEEFVGLVQPVTELAAQMLFLVDPEWSKQAFISSMPYNSVEGNEGLWEADFERARSFGLRE